MNEQSAPHGKAAKERLQAYNRARRFAAPVLASIGLAAISFGGYHTLEHIVKGESNPANDTPATSKSPREVADVPNDQEIYKSFLLTVSGLVVMAGAAGLHVNAKNEQPAELPQE